MELKKRLRLTYLAGFLMAVHFAVISYVNSSLLEKFVSNSVLSVLYIIGSLLSIIFLFAIPSLLRRYGSVPVFLSIIILEIFAVFGLGSINISLFVIFLFLILVSVDPLLYLCLDVNMEEATKVEGTTGSKRSILLTISNLAWLSAPLALIFLIKQNNFSNVYFLSGLVLIPLFFIVLFLFKNIKKTDNNSSSVLKVLRNLKSYGDKGRIIGAQIMLNFFYAWMVIYVPLLLSREIGFSWDKIGYIFIFMLLPFVLFELPAGFLADKKCGEREILTIGFFIMAIATFFIPFVHSQIFWIWALILFVTRIGASFVEISSESFFFKHVGEEDTGLISLFRVARPFAYVVAPLIAIPIMSYFSYSTSFFFLAIFTLLGLFFIPKNDTK